MRNTFFEVTSVSSSMTLPRSLSDQSMNATWLDASAPYSRYSESVANKQHLLIWKKKPHFIKVKINSKRNISKAVRFFHDTTVKEANKYLASYLAEDEDPGVFSLQESKVQYEFRMLRTKGVAGRVDHNSFC